MFFKKDKRIFLDYASTTPVSRTVFSQMKKYATDFFHNPSALYKEGVVIKKVISDARTRVARIISAKESEIIFTGSGTESINLAIQGVVNAYIKNNSNTRPHIITSVIEHPAVLETCRALESLADITYVSVNEDGLVVLSEIEKALCPETILVSIMHVNNEVGVVQPLRDISRIIQSYKKTLDRKDGEYPYFHSDCSQSPNYFDMNHEKYGLHMMTVDGSKIYGPKGIGMLYINRHVHCSPIMFGGGQEFSLRPGTENVSSIVGMACALSDAQEMREKESVRLSVLQDYFFEQIKIHIPDAIINGSISERTPNNINICIPNLNAEFAVIQLDEKGIACASMTACKNLDDESSSYVVGALNSDCASSSLRFTLGRKTTKKDIDFCIKQLVSIL